MTDPTEIACVAAGLTRAQREVLLAIRPGEERRALGSFNANSANSLASPHFHNGKPLLLRSYTGGGAITWYRHAALGLAVRDHILREKSGG